MPAKYAMQTTGYLIEFLHEQLRKIGPQALKFIEVGTSSDEFSTSRQQSLLFHMVVESVCYILCWRAGDFAQEGGLGQLLDDEEKGLKVILMSALTPLHIIKPEVARQFIATLTNLGVCVSEFDNIPHRDKDILCSAYPFDPYLLRHSSKFVTKSYRVWSEVNQGENLNATNEDSDSDNEILSSPMLTAQGRRPSKAFEYSPAMPMLAGADRQQSGDFTDVLMSTFSPFLAPSPGFGPMGAWPPTSPNFGASPTFGLSSPKISDSGFNLVAEGDDDGIMDDSPRNPSSGPHGSNILDAMLSHSAYRPAER